MFNDWERRILSKPMPVHWAGFESTTYRLQQAGWEFSAEQDYASLRTRLLLRHQGMQFHACTQYADTDFFAEQHNEAFKGIRFHVNWMTGGTVRVTDIHDNLTTMRPVDMQPTIIKAQNIEDMALFGAPLVRTKEVIVAPDSVPELMDRILELQQPGAQAHYEEVLRQMNQPGSVVQADGVRPQQQFHAQVMSLVA